MDDGSASVFCFTPLRVPVSELAPVAACPPSHSPSSESVCSAPPLPLGPCPVCPRLEQEFEAFRQAAYWKAMHGRALQREAQLKVENERRGYSGPISRNSSGTATPARPLPRLKRMVPLLEPVYEPVKRSQGQRLWHADETRWLVFVMVGDGRRRLRCSLGPFAWPDPARSRSRTHHSHVAWSGSDEEFQSQTPQPAWDAAWDRVSVSTEAGRFYQYFPFFGCKAYKI